MSVYGPVPISADILTWYVPTLARPSSEDHDRVVLLKAVRISLTTFLTLSACSALCGLNADSTLAMISVARMFAGVTAKCNPFFNRDTSALMRH